MQSCSEVTRTCEKHGDYLAKVVMMNGRQLLGSRCPQCEKAAEAASEATRDAQREREVREGTQSRWRAVGVPARFQEASLENYQRVGSDMQDTVIRRCQWFCDTWSERKRLGTSMIFAGSVGAGKTHLAVAVARRVVEQGSTARYVTVGDAMRTIRDSYDQDARRSEAQAIELFVAPALLVLDEVGAASGSEHERRMTFEIINKRYEQARSTVVVSNLTGEELFGFLGDRVVDRLRDGGGKLLVFDWGSFRK